MSSSLRLDAPTPLEYFAALVQEDVSLNLLEAAASLAQDEQPALDVQAVLAEVDGLARRLRQRLPADASAQVKLRSLCRFFHEELGFGGNVNNYYERGNSYVHQVLATRRGIPVSLAVIFLELASQLGLRAQGLAFPGHFLVRVRMGNGEVVLDPFSGDSLSRSRLDEMLQAFRGSTGLQGEVDLPVDLFLQPASARDILARMLRNLKEIHRAAGDWPRLLAVQQRLVVLLPHAAIERRDRGLVLESLGHWPAAAEDLEAYLAQEPQAPDGPLLQERVAQLRQRGGPALH
ncbi:tetratricopeptide repeat protein [Paucibacter sp. DJ1R-11]|uniref:SirB1 family protein n=1 Tax=unclassified Roseateles TaxID=2626991 RepID=UPI0021E3F53A|nr:MULTISPECIES: tetratricopeptide repeat protein [unclassified Roseateles]MCV2365243.1 tetratricopeptide repeat protein [Paucibacter sp. DJ1R-11]MCV2420855.1 tetratricopeptide repeat protein [Paucibacter sp. DJ4R-1]MCV2440054.1 tetratricopeptide repeat protein [Paucibacter sp. DJ2R-2]